MNKIKLQSVCTLSLLMLSQVGGAASALDVSTVQASISPSSSLTEKTKEKPSDKSTVTEAEVSSSKQDETQQNVTTKSTTASVASTTVKSEKYVVEDFKWGTSSGSFNEGTGILTIGAGTLTKFDDAPWNRKDDYRIDLSSIKKIVLNGDIVAPEDCSNLFATAAQDTGLTAVEEIDGLEHLKTSSTTNMSNMFRNMNNLKKINISKFDTKKVTKMAGMFNGCLSLTSLDLSNFDTSQVTNMDNMFFRCWGLTSLDLSNFDTSQVTNMDDMFYRCSGLTSLTLGDNFKFQTNAALGTPKPKTGTGTGNWIREDGNSKGYSPTEFMAAYGTGDLTAGTYVAELVTPKTELFLSAYTDKEKYTIGDKINTSVVIRHASSSEDGSEAKNITLSDLTQFTIGNSQELSDKVTIETYDSTDKKVDSKEEKLTDSLSLPDLKKGNYYKVVISGEAINNTDPSVDSNYNLKLSYSPDGVQKNIDTSIDQNIEIDSGDLKFSSVPDQLEFLTTPFSIDLNNKLIGRSDADWQLKVSDLRGTVAYGETKTVDRQNWNIYATAEAFKDEKGTAVSDGALSITYVQGDKQTDLSSDETLIASHDVKDETPKDNSETVIKWDDTEGIKAVVHDRSKLDTNKKYSSDMTFEIRLEP